MTTPARFDSLLSSRARIGWGVPMSTPRPAMNPIYEFGGVSVGQDGAARTPKARSNAQYIRGIYADLLDRKSTRLNSSHRRLSRMPSSA